MDAQLELIREQQKEVWNKFSPGWKKWDDFTMDFLQPMGDEIIRALELEATDQVLDIAGGTGEPGLSIAAVVKKGKVVITDLAEGMLAVALDKAIKRGLHNVETRVCDVSELPFDDNSFDAISCRMGFMFFPDIQLAAKEMTRVLKPGGRLSAAVWGTPEKNFWVAAIMGSIQKHLSIPPPPPGSPGMFRCGQPGLLAGIFREAGLKNVTEKESNGKMHCGNAENYWTFMNDVAAPVVSALSKADDAMKEKIRKEVFVLVEKHCPDKKANLDYGALIVSGTK